MARTTRDLPDRVCERCGALYSRHRGPSGALESTSNFLRRRYCGYRCSNRANAVGRVPPLAPRHRKRRALVASVAALAGRIEA